MSEFLSEQIQKLRKKLLDTSRRTNLVSFRHKPRSTRHTRVVDEVPANLWRLIESGNRLTFRPLPDIGEEPPDEKTDDFQQALAQAILADREYIDGIEKLENDDDLDESSSIITFF